MRRCSRCAMVRHRIQAPASEERQGARHVNRRGDQHELRVAAQQGCDELRLIRGVRRIRLDHDRLAWHSQRRQRVPEGFGFAPAVHLGIGEPAGRNHAGRMEESIQARAFDGVVRGASCEALDAEAGFLVADDAVSEHDDRRGTARLGSCCRSASTWVACRARATTRPPASTAAGMTPRGTGATGAPSARAAARTTTPRRQACRTPAAPSTLGSATS